MIDVQVTQTGLGLDHLGAFPERLGRALFEAMLESELLLERAAKERAPVGVGGAGGYRGSIAAMPPRWTGKKLVGGLGTNSPYAEPVELGTKPHFPPVQPLADWVKAKFGENDPDAARGIAFCIARKIAAHGTQGQHIFENALKATQDEIGAAFRRATKRALEGEGQ